MQVHGAQFSATRTLAQHFHETKFVQTLVPHRKTDGATCGLISRMDGAEINYRRLLMLIDEAGGQGRGLNRHWRLDVWVRVVALKGEILVLEPENILHLRVNPHLRQPSRRAR